MEFTLKAQLPPDNMYDKGELNFFYPWLLLDNVQVFKVSKILTYIPWCE